MYMYNHGIIMTNTCLLPPQIQKVETGQFSRCQMTIFATILNVIDLQLVGASLNTYEIPSGKQT